MDSFAHLHVHTDYSMLDGASSIRDLVDAAVADGQPAIAATDHGVLHGAVELYRAATGAGITPILGMEGYEAPGQMGDRDTRTPYGDPYYHLTLLAENNTGWDNLMRLSSAAFHDGFFRKPRFDLDALHQHRDGLIVMSGCLGGQVAQHLLADGGDGAMRTRSPRR